MKQALVAVDVNNLWHSCREIHGSEYRFDYQALQQLIKQLQTDPTKFRWVAYAISTPHRRTRRRGPNSKHSGVYTSISPSRNQRFISRLEQLGYLVKVRDMQYEKEKPFGSDWDVGIAVDAMQWIDDYDTFYLASGDGDYTPLLKTLAKRGKRIEVVTFKQTISQLLYSLAHRITYLSSEQVFDGSRRMQNGEATS